MGQRVNLLEFRVLEMNFAVKIDMKCRHANPQAQINFTS